MYPTTLSHTHFVRHFHRAFVQLQSALKAESTIEWEEKDYEGEIKKLEKEAEERFDAKVAELVSKLEVTGVSDSSE
jgi:hypothetical protein